jgi:hypothetical protein
MTRKVERAINAVAGPILMSERVFMEAVLEQARWRGWLCYHTHDSRRSPEGFPDVIAVRGERLPRPGRRERRRQAVRAHLRRRRKRRP